MVAAMSADDVGSLLSALPVRNQRRRKEKRAQSSERFLEGAFLFRMCPIKFFF